MTVLAMDGVWAERPGMGRGETFGTWARASVALDSFPRMSLARMEDSR